MNKTILLKIIKYRQQKNIVRLQRCIKWHKTVGVVPFKKNVYFIYDKPNLLYYWLMEIWQHTEQPVAVEDFDLVESSERDERFSFDAFWYAPILVYYIIITLCIHT